MTDCWGGYNQLGGMNNYTHMTVNHSENFVDPNTHEHTQTIEEFGGNRKDAIKKMHGVHEDRLVPYMDEIVFQWNHKDEDMFLRLLELVSLYYPANHQVTADLLAEKPVLH